MSTLNVNTIEISSASGINTITSNVDLNASDYNITAKELIEITANDFTITGLSTYSNIDITGGNISGISTIGVTSISATNYATGGFLVSGTETATTSGSTITLTSNLPSWAKKITILFNEVGTVSDVDFLVRLNDTSGYVSTSTLDGGNDSSSTTGFIIKMSASGKFSGIMELTELDSTTWISSSNGKQRTTNSVHGAGSLNSAVDPPTNLSLTGATFNSGSVNWIVEG